MIENNEKETTTCGNECESKETKDTVNTNSETVDFESGKKDKKTKKSKKDEEIAAIIAEATELSQKHIELKDTYMRVCAEYDNFRKRSMKEKDMIYSEAVADTITKLLPVIDNFERAINFNNSLNREKNDFEKGIELIFNQLSKYLDDIGVKEIEADGANFNPDLHYAVMHIEDENIAENTIVEVLQKGYALKDRVIRHAMVKVAN